MSLFSRIGDFLDARRGRAAALVLATALVCLFAASVPQFLKSPFQTDLLSLLPGRFDESIPAPLEKAFLEKLRSAESDRATILLSFSTETPAEAPGRNPGPGLSAAQTRAAIRAVDQFDEALERDGLFTKEAFQGLGGNDKTALSTPAASSASLAPAAAAGNLVRKEDEAMLRAAARDPKLAERRMLACLLRADSPKLLGFSADPFCLYDRWFFGKTAALPFEQTTVDGKTYIRVHHVNPAEGASRAPTGPAASYLLLMKPAAGVAASGEGRLTERIREAEVLARETLEAHSPEHGLTLAVTAAGVPLFTDAIAAQASRELTLIGSLASLGVAVLALLAFGRIATVLLMVTSVAIGFGAAVSMSLLSFGELALVTFVFGTTLIGVAVDYSTHWFALKRPDEDAYARRRRLLPSLLMAGGSSAAAYGVLALTPLPGLRQMAALAAGGVLATLAVVLVFGPFVERLAPKRETQLMRRLETKLAHLPRLNAQAMKRPAVLLLLAFFFGALVFGLSRLTFAPGIRDLSAAPAELVAAQATLQNRLELPSPAQAFFVSGKNLDEALAREAALLKDLKAQGDAKANAPHLAALKTSGLSQWLPTSEEQARMRALVNAAIEAGAPALQSRLGARPQGPGTEAVTYEALLETPLAPLMQHFVLKNDAQGAALMTMLSGVTPEMLPALESAARKHEGVRFLDITARMSETLSTYRTRVFELLAAGFFILWVVMTLRFGRGGWRAVLPAGLGVLAALAASGIAGLPATLFTALACVLLLGLGVDYGIFLSGNPEDGRTSAAVFFCGLTTMLSFGLLAFSATPALASFGFTILAGLVVIWVTAPLLRPTR